MRFGFIVVVVVLAASRASDAREQEGAIISAAVGHVKAGARALKQNDTINDGDTLTTGATSRAELILPEKIVARLSENSAFSFNGRRNLDVREGAILLQTPRGAHGARLVAGDVAVATAGTTVVFEHHATTYKLMVLQGTARLYRPKHLGDSMLVEPGQMVIADPKGELSDAVDFDDARFVTTCRLLRQFAPLPNAAAIARDGEVQARAKNKKQLIETNLVIFGAGNAVTVTDAGKIDNVSNASPTTPATGNAATQTMDSLAAVDTARTAATSR
jgi:ferric-dicitrate binding protein FerR (iron transport regulator)